MSDSDVKVYGADWCDDTKATRNNLDSLGVPYQYVNVERDAGAQAWWSGRTAGSRRRRRSTSRAACCPSRTRGSSKRPFEAPD